MIFQCVCNVSDVRCPMKLYYRGRRHEAKHLNKELLTNDMFALVLQVLLVAQIISDLSQVTFLSAHILFDLSQVTF